MRGLRIQEMACEIDQMLHPRSDFLLAHRVAETDISARLLPSRVDWIRDNQRVEVKHGKLLFLKSGQQWCCQFSRIKFAIKGVREQDAFDELWLAIYSPCGIHFFKHGKASSRDGAAEAKTATGDSIRIGASRKIVDVRHALTNIMDKMKLKGCQLVAEVVWENQPHRDG